MGDGPRHLAQDGAPPAVARRGLTAEALGAALLVAWADSCPRGEALGGGEAAHSCANLSNQGAGGGLGDAGNGLGQRHRVGARDKEALDLLLQLGQR